MQSKAKSTPLISADEAHKLGPGKAEMYALGGWITCGEHCSYFRRYNGEVIMYRAIKQPEPVEPHAELKAMYEQQVKNTAEGKLGGLDDFVWEIELKNSRSWTETQGQHMHFDGKYEYRCTPNQPAKFATKTLAKLKQ